MRPPTARSRGRTAALDRSHPLDDVFDRVPCALQRTRWSRAVVRPEPLEHRRTPGESPTKGDEEHLIAAAQPPRGLGLADRDRDRSRGGIAVPLDVDED